MSEDNDSQQTIRRGKHEKDYIVIGNALAQNHNLSYEARGMLIDLLSRPENWETSVSALQIKGKAGRDKVRRILNELVEANYIQNREPVRGDDSKITHWTPYIVNEIPYTPEPLPENPSTGNPSTGNQPLQSTEEESNSVPKGTSELGATWDEYLELVKAVFPNGGKAPRHLANMLRGRSKTGEYEEYNQDVPVSYGELQSFAEWYKRTYPEQVMVSTARGIDDYIGRYRKHVTSTPKRMSLFEEAVEEQRARLAAMQGGQG